MSRMPEPLYVCVHVPEFPVQALVRLRPQLAAEPVAVLEGHVPLEQVCAGNPAAFEAGVTRGMTRAEIEDMAGVTVLRRSAAEEDQACNVLLQAAGVFTPRVEIVSHRAGALDLVLDLSGTGRLFGSVQHIADELSQAISRLSFRAKLAVSTNFCASLCLAATAADGVPRIVPNGCEQAALGPLPLSALNLTADQADVVDLWGLRTLADLAALPETELAARLGQEGVRLRRLARGELVRHMVPREPELSFSELVMLEEAVTTLDALTYVLTPVLDQLMLRAQQHALALAAVTITFVLDAGGESKRTLRPALPVARREVLLRLLQLDLQAHPPAAGVLGVSVHAEPGPPAKVQMGLFSPESPESTRLEVTVARLTGIVGDDRVGSARLIDSQGPVRFVMDSFQGPPEPESPLFAGKSAVCAIRRCRPALRMTVSLQRSRPMSFRFAGRRYAVQQALGPWRASGHWWSGLVWSKEEWDLCGLSEDGEFLFCQVSRDLLRHKWKLEGVYD